LETYFQQLSGIYENNIDLFIVPSRFLQRKLAEHGFNAKIVYLPNPVDVESFLPCYEVSDYFIYFGRLVNLKGVKTLFKAMRYVNTSSHLYVIGEGELEEPLKEYVNQHGVSNITFLGHLPTKDIIPVIQGAAFTVFPSECYENCPMTILESFACGTPVIGSDIGGIPELIKDNRNGLLFESGNLRQLADRIQFLLDNPHRAIKMGRNGRRQVETTNHPQRYYQRMVEIYQQLLEDTNVRRKNAIQSASIGVHQYL
jgi:glycosyltransferase involved in cell wall biosynthesis